MILCKYGQYLYRRSDCAEKWKTYFKFDKMDCGSPSSVVYSFTRAYFRIYATINSGISLELQPILGRTCCEKIIRILTDGTLSEAPLPPRHTIIKWLRSACAGVFEGL